MQKTVSDFIRKYNLQTSAETRYIDLSSEVGELGKEIIKGSNYGAGEYEKTAQTEGEAGDCMFSLLALCHSLDIDAEKALLKALRKYEARFERKKDIGSGD